jgi:O-antigen chain-terminating methyltransferase
VKSSRKEIDVERVLNELRAEVRKASGGSTEPQAFSPPAENSLAADLTILHSDYNIAAAPFTSHRRFLAKPILYLKRFARELLLQILHRQAVYNGANARVMSRLKDQTETLKAQTDTLKAQIATLNAQIETLVQQNSQLVETGSTFRQQMLEQLSAEHSALTDAQYAIARLKLDHNGKKEFDIGYFRFEQRYRGGEQVIIQRQRQYLEYFQGQPEVLDVGSGRGEFLELLRQAGIKGQGVDIDVDMANYSRGKGLDVVCGDAFEFLDRLDDDSVGGIFAAQFVEHFEPHYVVALVKLCHKKLRPGGVLILETPNPHCLTVFAETFYVDFTHVRPYHPAGLSFLLEAAGFERVENRFSSPADHAARIPMLNGMEVSSEFRNDFNRGVKHLNDLLYGFQDYAAIGRKALASDGRA